METSGIIFVPDKDGELRFWNKSAVVFTFDPPVPLKAGEMYLVSDEGVMFCRISRGRMDAA